MADPKRTPAGDAVTGLIMELFRLNGRLLAAGDKLVAGLGLTSARWQVLDSILAADRPQPVAWLARDMGANRQNVQRIVNDLEREGLVAFRPNPHHRRAQLVVLTAKGKGAYDAALKLQVPWADALAEGLDLDSIATTRGILSALHHKLHGSSDDEQN